MATEIIQVAATTSPNLWTAVGNSSKVVCVNSPDDDDTTYIKDTGRTQGQQYSLAANTIPVGSTINSVSVYSRCKRVGSGVGAWRIRVSLGASGVDIGTHNGTLSYASFTDVATRPGGGTWGVADFSTLQVRIAQLSSPEVRCTSLYAIVDYTPSTTTVTIPHTTDSYLNFQLETTHTTDSYRVVQLQSLHTVDAYLVVSSITVTMGHTTDVYLRTKLQKMYVAFIGNSPMKDFVELDSKIL